VGGTSPAWVEPSGDVDVGDVRVGRRYPLQVIVRASGAPVSGAEVVFVGAATLLDVRDATDEDGLATCLACEPWNVSDPTRLVCAVRAPGFAFQTRAIPLVQDAPVVFDLTPEGIIEGEVVNGAGDPLAGVNVLASNQEQGYFADVKTGADGRYRLAGALAGSTCRVAFVPRAKTELASMELELSAPDRRVVRLAPGGEVAVETEAAELELVRWGADAPAPRAYADSTFKTETEDGDAMFRRVPPGLYRLFATAPDRAPTLSAPFEVRSDEQSRIALTLAPGRRVRVKLRDDAGPVEHGSLSGSIEGVRFDGDDSEGQDSIMLPLGDSELEVWANEHETKTVTVPAGVRELEVILTRKKK
jgi:hypothetical protein